LNGRSRSKTFDRKIDAERFVAGTTTDMARGDWVDPRSARIRVDELADSWWATTVKLAPTTRRGYWQLLENHVRPYFGTRMQGTIVWSDVELFIAKKLGDGHNPKRVRDMVSIVSAVMKTAVRSGLRRDNPAADHSIPVRRPKIGRAAILTMAEVHRLVDHTRDPYKPAVWMLGLLGLRPAELCGLRVGAVDFPRANVHITETLNVVHGYGDAKRTLVQGPTKSTAGDRVLPMPAWLRDDLAAMLGCRDTADRDPSAPLFLAVKGAGRLEVPVLRDHVIRPALVAAGLPESFRTYDLRHTHASLLIEQGANPLEVAQRMGHTDASITLRVYGHIFEGAQTRLTEKLDALRESTAASAGDIVGLRRKA
jgi:integrase